jgi:HSP20 family molecular chaperone IbpA
LYKSELTVFYFLFVFPEHGNMHRINLDLTGFKPEDVKVSLKDRVVRLGT